MSKAKTTIRPRRAPKTSDQKIKGLANTIPLKISNPIDSNLLYIQWNIMVDDLIKSTQTNQREDCVCRKIQIESSEFINEHFNEVKLVRDSKAKLASTKSITGWTNWASQIVKDDKQLLSSLLVKTLMEENKHVSVVKKVIEPEIKIEMQVEKVKRKNESDAKKSFINKMIVESNKKIKKEH